MVTDFRSLGFGSLSQQKEGEQISEAEMQRRNKECMKKESALAKGLTYEEDSEDSAEVAAQKAVIADLERQVEATGSKKEKITCRWIHLILLLRFINAY